MAGHLCLRLIFHISFVYSNHKMLLSSCDSRNLNLSPFCNLTSTSLAMWQPSVLETYGNLKTDYIKQISGPMRLKYPNSMADEELIMALTKVKPCKGLCSNLPPQTNYEILLLCSTSAPWHSLCNWPTIPQGHLYYNAYENDIAIVSLFFGEPTVFGVFNIKSQNWLFNWRLLFSEFERSPKMTWLDFISGFGGICGLCLGISFVSLVEILYWFSIRLCQNFWSN